MEKQTNLSITIPLSALTEAQCYAIRDAIDRHLAKPAVAVAPGAQLGDDDNRWNAGTSEGRVWAANDRKAAREFYERIGGEKAKLLFDLFLDHPGQLLTTSAIRGMTGDTFGSSKAVAGCLKGTYNAWTQAEGRRWPITFVKGAKGQDSSWGIRAGWAKLFR